MNECVFIYLAYHIMSQVKAPLATAISAYLISLTHLTHA